MIRINIAIDGYAGCGKSTLARDLASELAYVFVDTGALYRALTYLSLQMGEGVEAGIAKTLEARPKLSFSTSDNHLLIDGVDRESEIREMRVAQRVSEVAAIPAVRDYLKTVQRDLIQNKGVVMEGRDIGTVIMPEAELKLFITASIETRVQRRMKQLAVEGKPVSEEEVRLNLQNRDSKDATREVAPLAMAADAVAIDTTALTRQDQLRLAVALVNPLADSSELLPNLLRG